MGPGYEFREDLLPIALMTARRSFRVDDVDGVMSGYRSLVARCVRYVSIVDVRGPHPMPDALTRRKLAAASAEFEPLSRVWSIGSAMVLDSEVGRRLLTAIEWVTRPQRPMVYFNDMGSAVDWAIQKIEAAGLLVTPTILAFRDEVR